MKMKHNKAMAGKYVMAWNKPGTAMIGVSISEDGYRESEKKIAVGMVSSEAKKVVNEYIDKGYELRETFVSAIWAESERKEKNPNLYELMMQGRV